MSKYLDQNGLIYLWSKVKALVGTKVDKVEGKGLSTNDFTDEDKAAISDFEPYELPTASADKLGGVKIGDGLKITDGVLSTDNDNAGDTETDAAVDELGRKIDAVMDSMYQEPTYTQFKTKGNFTVGDTEDATSKTLSELLGENLPEDLSFVINQVTIGSYSSSTVLSQLLSDINENSDDGVDVAYDTDTKEFIFTATKVGPAQDILFDSDLAKALFEPTEISGESPNFKQAYNAPAWVNDVFVSTPVGTIELNNITSDETVEDIADRLNSAFGKLGPTASYNKYTGQLEIKNANGTPFDYKMWAEHEALGHRDLTFNKAYAPDISYTLGQDACFFVIKVNGEKQSVVDKTVALEIPTKTSELTNDSQFQTKTEVESAISTAINDTLSSVYTYKGSVENYASLPTEDNAVGDVWDVSSTGMNYAWTGEAWDALGMMFEIENITNAEIDSITDEG